MNTLTLTVLIWLGSLAAGFLGSLTGLGGGVVIVPMLTLLFRTDLHYAMGASLVSVIATSSGAAAAYLREGYSNIRIGMFLEIATTVGALGGAYLLGLISGSVIAVIFGVVLIISAYLSSRPRPELREDVAPDPLSVRLRMGASYPTPLGPKTYQVHRVGGGFVVMFIAGILSGLLGIGSGAFKVLAMDQVMQIPFKVSTTTSNFMIGVTAAASAGIYLHQGYIVPGLAMPVMLGVLLGASLGARVLVRAKTAILRLVFGLVIFALAIEMIVEGIRGTL